MSTPQPPERNEDNHKEREPATPRERAFTPDPRPRELRADDKPPEEKRIERFRER
jgi:hypothetical protein